MLNFISVRRLWTVPAGNHHIRTAVARHHAQAAQQVPYPGAVVALGRLLDVEVGAREVQRSVRRAAFPLPGSGVAAAEENVRQDKIRNGLSKIAGDVQSGGTASVIHMNNISALEINSVREFMLGSLNQFYRLSQVNAEAGELNRRHIDFPEMNNVKLAVALYFCNSFQRARISPSRSRNPRPKATRRLPQRKAQQRAGYGGFGDRYLRLHISDPVPYVHSYWCLCALASSNRRINDRVPIALAVKPRRNADILEQLRVEAVRDLVIFLFMSEAARMCMELPPQLRPGSEVNYTAKVVLTASGLVAALVST
ncbi:hypothetical protein ON010_g7190 [Phytophthora cinnamomi]|nr:hypothetical protein ON010_g7190 [Phytophthora cinnamomi]